MLGERRAGERVAVHVVRGHDLVFVDEPTGKSRCDEARTARDEDPLALEHAASLPARYRIPRHANGGAHRSRDRGRRLRREPGNGGLDARDRAHDLRTGPGPRHRAAGAVDAALRPGGRHGAARARPSAASSTPWRSRSHGGVTNLVCTDQYGGPQQAVIAGTHRGNRVWTRARDAERLRDLAREAARVPRAGLLRQPEFVTRAVALTALIMLLLAGCGGDAGDASRRLGDRSDVDALAERRDAATRSRGRFGAQPAGGDHPDPEAACAALTAVADPFGPVAPPDRCAEIPGGEEAVAVLDGDYRGRKVHSRFTHANACVSGRWDRIAPVFPTGS